MLYVLIFFVYLSLEIKVLLKAIRLLTLRSQQRFVGLQLLKWNRATIRCRSLTCVPAIGSGQT